MDYKRCSKWPPFSLRIFSNLSLAEAQALLTRSGSIFAEKSSTMDFSSSIVEGFILKTWFIVWPQKKKSKGFRSGELGGHGIFVLLEMTWPPNFDCKNARFWWVVWHMAPSCMKKSFSLSALCLSNGQIFFSSKSVIKFTAPSININDEPCIYFHGTPCRKISLLTLYFVGVIV